MHSMILETTSSNFQPTISVSGVSGVFLFFLMHLLSFSLCAELLDASSRGGEGVPDSPCLVEFDVLSRAFQTRSCYSTECDDVMHSKHCALTLA